MAQGIKPTVRNGTFAVPEGPGLGLEINEDGSGRIWRKAKAGGDEHRLPLLRANGATLSWIASVGGHGSAQLGHQLFRVDLRGPLTAGRLQIFRRVRENCCVRTKASLASEKTTIHDLSRDC